MRYLLIRLLLGKTQASVRTALMMYVAAMEESAEDRKMSWEEYNKTLDEIESVIALADRLRG